MNEIARMTESAEATHWSRLAVRYTAWLVVALAFGFVTGWTSARISASMADETGTTELTAPQPIDVQSTEGRPSPDRAA